MFASTAGARRLGAPRRLRPDRRGGWWLRVAVLCSLPLAGTVLAATPSGARPVPTVVCGLRGGVGGQPTWTSPAAVLAAMTLPEKVAFLGLQPVPLQYIEEENPGIPRLCIPPLILRDGPVGLAYGARGVTAFPSDLSLAATFDPELARQYGIALGREARAQGTMGIQGPGLDVSVFDNWGRSFENLGEDPTLASVLGSALVGGIQRTGEFAMAKHLGEYVQETARSSVDEIASPRAEQEIYLAPFRAAVHAGVASIMCAAGQSNGVENCSDSQRVASLRQDGFGGFVRTDAGASTNEVAALEAGVDLFRPYDPSPVEAALADDTLSVAVLDRAVLDVLTVMFRYGDVPSPIAPDAARTVTSPGSVATSLAVAEQSMVLLKNDGVLPLSSVHGNPLVVIGAAASLSPIVSGTGSSQVGESKLVTDLAGIEQLGTHHDVTYLPAASSVGTVTPIPVPAGPDPSASGFQEATLALPQSMSGLVDFTYSTTNPTRLTVDGTTVLQNVATSSGAPVTFEKAIELSKGSHDVVLAWPDGAAAPAVSVQPVDLLIQQAAASARAASTAIVVVGERDGEGVDRGSLALPGYQDQLVAAVAAANPNTIVVIHSGGPVLMPWLGSVAAVLEAWYPGQVAGTALEAVLAGAVDASGRLPVAFPTSDGSAPMIPSSAWPYPSTTNDLTALGDLGVGSEWYAAHGVMPLFAFGYGLSYTTFSIGAISAGQIGSTIKVRVPVANTGRRFGRFVALADVSYPPSSGEPPRELKAFSSVTIAAQHSTTLDLAIPVGSLRVWQGAWAIPSGTYTIAVGGRSTPIDVVGSG